VEFVTSERSYPWCVDLGSFMLIAKAAGKSKHSFRFVSFVSFRFAGKSHRLRKDPAGNTLEGIFIPIADDKKFSMLQMTIITPSDFISNADGNFSILWRQDDRFPRTF